jgi:hypothetical protein
VKPLLSPYPNFFTSSGEKAGVRGKDKKRKFLYNKFTTIAKSEGEASYLNLLTVFKKNGNN